MFTHGFWKHANLRTREAIVAMIRRAETDAWLDMRDDDFEMYRNAADRLDP